MCFSCAEPRWCSSACALADSHIGTCLPLRIANGSAAEPRCQSCYCQLTSSNWKHEAEFYCEICWETQLEHGTESLVIKPTKSRERKPVVEGLELLKLSPHVRDILLATANESSKVQLQNGSSIIEKLKNIDATASQQFQSKTVAVKELVLRLLSPHGQSMDSMRGFICISYCWHSKDWTMAEPLSKRPDHAYTKEMHQYIIEEALQIDEGIFLDQACIDQGNEAEKRTAISVMDLIYRSARVVLILLEDIWLTASEWDAIGLFYPFREEFISGHDEDNIEASKQFSKALSKILSARWFMRAWCLHEYLCSKTARILVYVKDYGIMSYHLSRLLAVVRLMDQNFHHADSMQNPTADRLAALEVLTQDVPPDASICRNYFEILHNFTGTNCTFESDKMSIFLNVSKVGLSYTPKSVVTSMQVLYDFAMISFAEGNVDILARPFPLELQSSSKKYPNVISWMSPYPGPLIVDTSPPPGARVDLQAAELSCNWSTMDIEVMVLSNCEYMTLSEDIKGKAYAFEVEELQESIGGFFEMDRVHELVHVPLAAIMQLGLSWFANFAGPIRQQMDPVVWRCSDGAYAWCHETVERLNWKAFNSGFRKIFQTNRTETEEQDATEKSSGVDPESIQHEEVQRNILWFIDLFYSHPNSKVFSGIINLDVSDAHLGGITDLTLDHWEKSRTHGFIVVIPMLMTEPRFGMHHRLWILRPIQRPAGMAYQIVSKHMVIGIGNIDEQRPRRVLECLRIVSWENDRPAHFK
jgi:heterokaryon incompatibility protein (HET)